MKTVKIHTPDAGFYLSYAILKTIGYSPKLSFASVGYFITKHTGLIQAGNTKQEFLSHCFYFLEKISANAPTLLTITQDFNFNVSDEAYAVYKQVSPYVYTAPKNASVKPKINKPRGFKSWSEYTKVRNAFYQSNEWREVRYKALLRSNGRCVCCGRSAKDGAVLNVDHIIPLVKAWDRRTDLDNLQVLCKDCNFGKSGTDETRW